MSCKHENFFADVQVDRLEDIGRFQANITIKCDQCGKPFRFIGLPSGVDLNGAAVSIDGTEGRFAIAPRHEVLSQLDEKTPAGFTVRRTV